MSTTARDVGSATRWGPLWGARPRDWARNEEQQVPTYEEAARRAGIAAGQRVLEIGCGSGVFLELVAGRGAMPFGLDASEALVALARARVPAADVRVGDMEALPYDDDSFDVVAGFNSFFFATDMVAALREAGRVAKPGAPVVIQVWGRPERCDLTAMKQAIAQLAPPPDPAAPPPPTLWEDGVLESIAGAAGLTPRSVFDVSWPYAFADDYELARAMIAPGLVIELVRAVGEAPVREAILAALAPYRTPADGYRLENEWHTVIATA